MKHVVDGFFPREFQLRAMTYDELNSLPVTNRTRPEELMRLQQVMRDKAPPTRSEKEEYLTRIATTLMEESNRRRQVPPPTPPLPHRGSRA